MIALTASTGHGAQALTRLHATIIRWAGANNTNGWFISTATHALTSRTNNITVRLCITQCIWHYGLLATRKVFVKRWIKTGLSLYEPPQSRIVTVRSICVGILEDAHKEKKQCQRYIWRHHPAFMERWPMVFFWNGGSSGSSSWNYWYAIIYALTGRCTSKPKG